MPVEVYPKAMAKAMAKAKGKGGMSAKEHVEERTMTLGEFSATYLTKSKSKSSSESIGIGYVAQHSLLEQIDSLGSDCMSAAEVSALLPTGSAVTTVNAWIGSEGTVTPLHYDTYENLFVQLVGTKFVRLYDKCETGKLYVKEGGGKGGGGAGGQGNMSPVSVEDVDEGKYPKFKEAEYREFYVRPGDALYIPEGCWHYIRSVGEGGEEKEEVGVGGGGFAASVNYWF